MDKMPELTEVWRLNIRLIPGFFAIGFTAVRMGETTSIGISVLLWRASISLSLQAY